jgi:hypothetical protein
MHISLKNYTAHVKAVLLTCQYENITFMYITFLYLFAHGQLVLEYTGGHLT